jgi:hypothetical protein
MVLAVRGDEPEATKRKQRIHKKQKKKTTALHLQHDEKMKRNEKKIENTHNSKQENNNNNMPSHSFTPSECDKDPRSATSEAACRAIEGRVAGTEHHHAALEARQLRRLAAAHAWHVRHATKKKEDEINRIIKTLK